MAAVQNYGEGVKCVRGWGGVGVEGSGGVPQGPLNLPLCVTHFNRTYHNARAKLEKILSNSFSRPSRRQKEKKNSQQQHKRY